MYILGFDHEQKIKCVYNRSQKSNRDELMDEVRNSNILFSKLSNNLWKFFFGTHIGEILTLWSFLSISRIKFNASHDSFKQIVLNNDLRFVFCYMSMARGQDEMRPGDRREPEETGWDSWSLDSLWAKIDLPDRTSSLVGSNFVLLLGISA